MHRTAETTRLRRFIETEATTLVGTLRMYLIRAGLSGRGQSLDAAASELLNEVVLEALRHEDRFRAAGQPRAWLLGIAANLIRRKQADAARRAHREPLIRDLIADENTMSDDDLFDWIVSASGVDAVSGTDTDDDTDTSTVLATLSADDQRTIRLAVLYDMDGDALAAALNVSPGTARVRLHRAIKRLRTRYELMIQRCDELDGKGGTDVQR